METESGTTSAPVHQPPSPAEVFQSPYVEPTMVTRERQLEDALRAMTDERDFLREVLRALVERKLPMRIG